MINRPVGLPGSMWPQVDEAAKKAGKSRSAWFAGLASAALGLPHPASPKAAPAEKCMHPIGRRDHFGNCFACGEKVGAK